MNLYCITYEVCVYHPVLLSQDSYPFTDRFSIQFNNATSAKDVTIGISDLQGRRIFDYHAGSITAGKHTLSVPLQGVHFTDGMYLVTLRVNGVNVKTVPLLKSKK